MLISAILVSSSVCANEVSTYSAEKLETTYKEARESAHGNLTELGTHGAIFYAELVSAYCISKVCLSWFNQRKWFRSLAVLPILAVNGVYAISSGVVVSKWAQETRGSHQKVYELGIEMDRRQLVSSATSLTPEESGPFNRKSFRIF
jgi:hypothetical protein